MPNFIQTEIKKITDVSSFLNDIFKDVYNLSLVQIARSLSVFNNYISHFRNDIFGLIEFPYVDKVYRDSYYHYYASKNQEYKRDCIRVSFFDRELKISDFRDPERYDDINNSYLGFVVIRPTFPHIMGRSIVSPKAIITNNFKICSVLTSTTANGLKLSVSGFPHSSQNTETIACAETTIWSVMEYFGIRYPEYTPTLPSKIGAILSQHSFERLLPSKGLRADQISYALRELGFGVKLYHREVYGKDLFLILLRMYIESGIPVISAIQSNTIGHAQCIIGRARFTDNDVDELNNSEEIGKGVSLLDIEKMNLEYVFIDDNYPPYQITQLENPGGFYSDEGFKECEITSFIVPLYSKIYLDADAARAYVKSLIKQYIHNLDLLKDEEVILKVFLASSRSYKDYVSLNSLIDSLPKELILRVPMPKFVWVAELSNRDLIKNNLINGLLIVDATETKHHGLIAGFIGNYYFSENLNEIVQINVPLQPFKNYSNNLR
ncbi:hypothetical protein [Hyunsoonleella ulvae]|uniref:hypothetical protein n=2 Tax=Flavobacteriaceae TaxID=49546 RepID=UPI00193AC5AB|nr:hypothetical protein [Hyunsoonleella ulvae]